MAARVRKLMDMLYLACAIIAGVALVLISAVIPWAVFTRYVLNSAASWPEPTAVLLCLVGGFLSLSSLQADIDGAAAVGGIVATGAG